MRLLLAIGVLTASASLAEACAVSSGAYFDFAQRVVRYTGKEQVRYFIGRVLVFYSKTDPPRALMHVIRDYSADWGLKTLLRLPDVADMKIQSFGPCIGPKLLADQVGLFGYYEKDGELWLAWEKGPDF